MSDLFTGLGLAIATVGGVFVMALVRLGRLVTKAINDRFRDRGPK